MDTTVALIEDRAVLSLCGRFDFNAHHEYREALERLMSHAEAHAFEVDLSRVSYLDSSALGMLLVLRERANRANAPVALVGAQGSVRQVLDIANFSRIFAIR
jgi:anti-anti-sigma factor